MREPKLWILGLRLELFIAAQHDADLVEQRRAVDFLFQIGGVRLLERGGDRLQGGQMRREGGRAESAVAIIVTRHAGLGRGNRVEMPVQIEERLLDVAETHALSNRWHSSSDRTRSVRLAASNSLRHATSSFGS